MNDLLNLVFDFRKYVEHQIVSANNDAYNEIKKKVVMSLTNLSKTKQQNIQVVLPGLYKIYDTFVGEYAHLYLPKSEIVVYHKYV